ncbi:MAG: MBL fold metallo-hydrolase [Thaumarchaeota archaeon]|nr:MBL fold metallo-hydrolase [Nitrososphaerota archaeon]
MSPERTVRQIPVGPMANFVYVLADGASGEALVVDSGWETGPILKVVAELRAKVKYVVASHEHFDHTSTLRELADATGAELVAHQASPLQCDRRVSDRETLKLGRNSVRVLHTPGHTPDSICLHDGLDLFSGDTLFVGTIGRFERSDADAIYSSLYETLLRLPDATMIYPGHDYGDVPFRTLGEEKRSNPYLMAGDIRRFRSLFS